MGAPSNTAAPRRRVWVIVVVAVACVGLLIGAPAVVSRFRFRESALLGMTPDQVMSRFHEPEFASTPEQDVPGEPVWQRIDGPGRAALLARPRFLFGYRSVLGDGFSVHFENGKVVRVTVSSK